MCYWVVRDKYGAIHGGCSPPHLLSQGHTGRQLCTSGQATELASPPDPMPQARTEHHPLNRGMSRVCWAGLCGEWAARQEESPSGMGQEGEGVSVGLLPSHCLPPQKYSSAWHGNSPASPVCCKHVLIFFSSASSCLSSLPCCECQQLGPQR